MGDSCILCKNDRILHYGCTKRKAMVCEKHTSMKCPVCGDIALWTEQRVGSQYYLCMNDQCDYIKYVQTAATC